MIRLENLSEECSKIGGNEAIVTHAVNKNSMGWHGYWRHLTITLFLGSSEMTIDVAYDDKGYVNGFGELVDPTSCAKASERSAISILESLGYYVVTA